MEFSENRKAYFDYEIIETIEGGIELLGFEVKSIKAKRASLLGAFVLIKNSEAWLLNMNVPRFQSANTPKNYEPTRTRRLLIHKNQAAELVGKTSQGLTIIPLKLYSKNNRVKVLIGLARHKKKTDKRELIKKRETKREIDRIMKQN